MLALTRIWRLADGERDFARTRERRLFGQRLRPVRHVGAADHDGEFVAAQAGDQARPVDQRAQPLGDRAQQLIAAGVAERVVDLLELVEVQHQQRDLALRRFRLGEPRSQVLVQRVAVGEAGQRVVLGQIP